jgi:hypothetical protein
VSGAPASPPAGNVDVTGFAAAGCTGPSSALGPAMLLAVPVDTAHSADIANDAGADSATTWVANGAGQLATNWAGSLFAGNDLANFASSSMGWVFRGVPLTAEDDISSTHLSLRIRKSRPSVPDEVAGTWTTRIAADTADGSGFDGLSRAAFLARFNSAAVGWQISFSYAERDPFSTNDGATWAASPDITRAIVSRVAGPAWVEGGAIAVGLLNAGTVGIAEAQVVDLPGNAVLNIEWTSHDTVQRALSPAWIASVGEFSYRAHYVGDGTYAPADSGCISLLVTPPDADGDGYSDADEIALAKDPRSYCVVMRSDVNGDGTVNLLDLAMVASGFGKPIPSAPERLDQNADDKINLLDLSIVASVFRQNIEACP